MSVNAGGWFIIAVVAVAFWLAGALLSLPRLRRCSKKIWSDEHGWVRCRYRDHHMQRRHFWMKKRVNGRESIEWIEEDE